LQEYAAKEKLEIVIGAAPPHFQIFAGGFPRRRRRRNAFELSLGYSTSKEKSNFVGSSRFARPKPQKNPEKNIGSNHILILGEENF